MHSAYLVPGTRCQVPGTRYLVPGTWYLAPGTWYRYLAPGTRYKVTRYQARSLCVLFTYYPAVKEAITAHCAVIKALSGAITARCAVNSGLLVAITALCAVIIVLVPGAWYQVPGTWYQVPRYQGTKVPRYPGTHWEPISHKIRDLQSKNQSFKMSVRTCCTYPFVIWMYR